MATGASLPRERPPGSRGGVTLGRVRTLLTVERVSGESEHWAATLGGDSEAFAALFDLHKERVYRHALRLLSNVHDAEDVTAGAFLELWRRRASVRLVEGSVLPWLLVTVTNLARNSARSLRRYRALLAALPRSAPSPGPSEVTVDEIEEAQAERLRAALRSLSPADSAIIALTAFEGFSPSQAASALGISDGAARARLHRARARVAAVLDRPPSTGRNLATKEAK
jgi:RNA polymerase sigma factor (sigma-70 family)